jgi:ABC-2 type transport system permease protein
LTFVAVLATNLLFGVIESVRLSDSIEHVWKVVWIPRAWFSAHALLLYALVVMMLWYLPILAWFLLISAWARRAVILWAVLPPLALMFLEKVLFDTGYVASLLRDRFIGWFSLAIDRSAAAEHSMTFDGERIPMTSRLSDTLDPASFFSSPGLWLGLAAAVVMVWGAILLRRRRSET